MRTRSCALVAHSVILMGTLFVSAASAQNFSPYFKTTGNRAHDQYNDAVLCSAVLEAAASGMMDNEERERLEGGIGDALALARLLLESGNVVDVTGAVLALDNLPIDRRNARADWQTVLYSIEDEGATPVAEIARCLSLYKIQ